jgi:hypothetical protein
VDAEEAGRSCGSTTCGHDDVPGRRHAPALARLGHGRRRRPGRGEHPRDRGQGAQPAPRPAGGPVRVHRPVLRTWVQVEGEAEIVSLPEAMEPLVDYYRSVAGEHPTGTTTGPPWSASAGSSSASRSPEPAPTSPLAPGRVFCAPGRVDISGRTLRADHARRGAVDEPLRPCQGRVQHPPLPCVAGQGVCIRHTARCSP